MSQKPPDSSIVQYDITDFEYELPAELIAQQPLSSREASRLMTVDRRSGRIDHKMFSDVVEMLGPGDVLVLNDTRVIPAKLDARRISGGKVDILLIKARPGAEGHWEAMASPLRKLHEGEVLCITCGARTFEITVAGFCQTEDGQRRAVLDLGKGKSVFELLAAAGSAPLPPYIHRSRDSDTTEDRSEDLDRYQTVFAKTPGAVAAPTAGLHFSAELLHNLSSKGVKLCFVTLHVGPGTFKPVTSSVEEHSVEAEYFFVSAETAETVNEAKRLGNRVIAVGTTSCRALETAGSTGILEAIDGATTSLYIKPGHQFKIVDCLITNFHLSRSSLLILVSAFCGHELVMNAYQLAVKNLYRFYSYGDAMFIY